MLPNPPQMALAVPTMLAENMREAQYWQGTKVAPMMPMKNLEMISPFASEANPANPMVMDPIRSRPAMAFRGP